MLSSPPKHHTSATRTLKPGSDTCRRRSFALEAGTCLAASEINSCHGTRRCIRWRRFCLCIRASSVPSIFTSASPLSLRFSAHVMVRRSTRRRTCSRCVYRSRFSSVKLRGASSISVPVFVTRYNRSEMTACGMD